jgi:hypothetical protein
VAGWSVFTITSAIIARQNTGLLELDAFSDTATITLTQPNSDKVTAGKGDATIRLKPGDYQVTATDGTRTSGGAVSITKQQTTTLKLEGQQPVNLESVADYAGQDIHLSANNIFFLNTAESLLYTQPLGGHEARPYYTTSSALVRARWISATELFAENSGREWKYIKNGEATSVPFPGNPPTQEDDYQTPAADTMSVNPSGAYAYTADDKTVLFATNPSAPLEEIATAKTTATRTSVAPDGSVLLFTPANSAVEDDTKLLRDNTTTELHSTLRGMTAAAWERSSSKFAFTTDEGMSTYDLSSGSVTQVLGDRPTNPYAMAWIDDTTLMYAHDQALWKYDLDKKLSFKLSSFEGGINARDPFTVAPDNHTVYFGTVADGDGKGGKIYRLVPGFNDLSDQEQKSIQEALNKTTAPSHELTFSGIDDFIDEGLSTDQLDNLRYSLSQFVASEAPEAKNVNISDIDFLAPQPGTVKNSMEFVVRLDSGPALNAKIDYWNLIALRFYLFDSSGAIVYDSGDITTQQ